MSDKTSETKATGTGVRMWTGKLRLNGERRKEGPEVEARILVAGDEVLFQVREILAKDWRGASADEIHAASWLRALGATGSEVG